MGELRLLLLLLLLLLFLVERTVFAVGAVSFDCRKEEVDVEEKVTTSGGKLCEAGAKMVGSVETV